MRILVTGATGWIGSAVTDELLAAGHEVVGLARSDASATSLQGKGAAALRSGLADLDTLRAGADAADGVVHLGFVHDFSDYAASGRTERSAVQALLDTLEGSDRPLLLASGVALTPGTVLTEDVRSPAVGPDAPRGGSEALAMEYADRGVRAVGLRFAPTVHGVGDHGFMATLATIARERGLAGYVGDGSNRWAAVHRSDAARLVRLALHDAPAGSVVHAVAEEGVPARDIAAGLGAAIGVPTGSVAEQDATEHFGWIAMFFGLDLAASSAQTRERFGWTPTGPTLAEDLAAGACPGR